MIKFFQKVRRNFLKENRFSKYLIYAIGEITLVIIGILIALQINNWNEDRKTKLQELKTLKELRSDLMQNLIDININIGGFKVCKNSNENIIYHIENNLPYNDSLDFHFANLYPYIVFSANQTTYENLKQIGLNLITNDSLRNSISDLYANDYYSYKNSEDIYLVEHYQTYIKPMYMSEFTSFDYKTSLKPKDYKLFIQNKQYKQIMQFTIVLCDKFSHKQDGFKIKIENLIKIIDQELANQ